MKIAKTAATLLLAMSVSVQAFAQIGLNTSGKLLTISGSSNVANTETVLVVLKEGITSTDYKQNPSPDKIEYFWQGTTDENGKYSFTMYLDGKMEYGEYLVMLGDGVYSEEKTYTYVSEENRDKQAVIELLNSAVNSDTIKGILQNNTSTLGITGISTDTQWNSVSKTLLGSVGAFKLDNIDTYISLAVTEI